MGDIIMSFKAYVQNFYDMRDMAPVQHVGAHSRPFANAAKMGYDPAGTEWTYQYFSTCEITYGGAALIANHGPADHIFYILEGEGYSMMNGKRYAYKAAFFSCRRFSFAVFHNAPRVQS